MGALVEVLFPGVGSAGHAEDDPCARAGHVVEEAMLAAVGPVVVVELWAFGVTNGVGL